MKKGIVFLIVSLILVMALLGCSTKTSTTTAATTSAPTTTKTTTSAPASTTTSAPASTTTTKPPTSTTAPSTTAASGPQYGGTLIYVRNTGIAVLGAPSDMPSFSWYNPMISPVCEQLIIMDTSGAPAPWLAKSVDVTPDGKTITFHLNSGIKFQDGTVFDAAAVKYNFDAVVAAKVAGSDIFGSVASYDIVDPLTLRMNLKQYDARILPALASSTVGQMVSPTALAKPATPDTAAKLHLVGTGPFTFDSWQRDQYVKYNAWAGYWQQGKPYVKAIEFRNNASVPTSLLSLKAGEVNWVENVDPSDFIAMQKQGFTGDISSDLFFIFSIFLDSANAESPFSKLGVRQAVEYAIDREGMAKGIGQGTMSPIYQQGVEKDPWFVKGQPKLTYNVAKAKQLLADAGYPNGFTTPITSDVRVRQDQLVAIQSYLEAVGIKTTLDMADVPRFTGLTQNGWKGLLVPGFPNGDAFNGWLGLYNSPIFTYPSMSWPTGWKDGMTAIVSEVDLAKRMALMQASQKKLYDGSLIITYIGDSPRSMTDGTVMDTGFYKYGIMGYWEPSNVWLKKK
jgi:ABC-type transport system substrate-binding protein